MLASLNYGSQRGYQSIALPAMGTGNLQFPRDVVANTMFDTVIEFSRANPNTTLKDVRFVLFNKDQPTIDVSDLLIFINFLQLKKREKKTRGQTKLILLRTLVFILLIGIVLTYKRISNVKLEANNM